MLSLLGFSLHWGTFKIILSRNNIYVASRKTKTHFTTSCFAKYSVEDLGIKKFEKV